MAHREFDSDPNMGEQTMSNMNDRIQDWREALNCREVCGASDLDELELHLREEITNLTETGLSPAEAFMVASGRLGDALPLAQEFAKVNPNAVFHRRLLWMSAGVLGYMLATYCATGLSKCVALLAAQGGLRGYGLGLVVESLHIVLLIAGVLGIVYLIKHHASRPALPKCLGSLRNKVILISTVAVIDIALFLGPILFTVLTARILRPEDFGKMAMVAAYVNFFLPIAASLFLVVLVIKLSTPVGKAATS
jgi:hypothetical protein